MIGGWACDASDWLVVSLGGMPLDKQKMKSLEARTDMFTRVPMRRTLI